MNDAERSYWRDYEDSQLCLRASIELDALARRLPFKPTTLPILRGAAENLRAMSEWLRPQSEKEAQ